MNTTGKFLSYLRMKKKYKQIDIAEKLCVTDKTVSKWETDKSIPDNEYLIDLSKIYHVSVEELLIGKYNKRKRLFRLLAYINIILLLCILPFLIYLIIFYKREHNSFNIYQIYTEDENYDINGYLIQKNNKYYINISVDITLTKDDYIELYNNNDILYHSNDNNILVLIDDYMNLNIKIFKDNNSNLINIKYRKNNLKQDKINYTINTKYLEKIDNNSYHYKDDNIDVFYYKATNYLVCICNNEVTTKTINFDLNNNIVDSNTYENDTGIIIEKYSYNLNTKNNLCNVGICSSLDEDLKMLDKYKTLFFG